MSNNVMVMADTAYPPTTVFTQLTTMNATTKITSIIVGGENMAEQAAAMWAEQNGVPWVAYGHYMDGAGMNQFYRGVFLLNLSNPDQLVAAGTTAKPVTAAAAATVKGKTVVKI